jgi:hypothetical protein
MGHVYGHPPDSSGDANLWMDFADYGGGVADFDPSTYGLGGPADIEQSFIGDPAGLWKTARSKALGQRAFQPQFQRNIMAGFDPAWGGYLLGGGTGGTFADYLRGSGGQSQLRPGQGGINAWGTPNLGIGSNWANVLAASRALDPNAPQQVDTLGDLGRQQAYQAYIDPAVAGETAARQNALAIAGAAMGGGVGYGASMRQRALGNLYDIYSQRALGAGAPGGGFLGYLGGLTGTGAPATTAVASPPAAGANVVSENVGSEFWNRGMNTGDTPISGSTNLTKNIPGSVGSTTIGDKVVGNRAVAPPSPGVDPYSTIIDPYDPWIGIPEVPGRSSLPPSPPAKVKPISMPHLGFDSDADEILRRTQIERIAASGKPEWIRPGSDIPLSLADLLTHRNTPTYSASRDPVDWYLDTLPG